jgi:DNA-directed RNA polymerase III subunit RPC1
MSGVDMMRVSSLQVCSRELYRMGDKGERKPAPFGCLDPRLGISGKSDLCGTCNKKLSDCAGHFGHIPLELPVFHIGFLKAVIEILQNICKTCSRVLLSSSDRVKYSKLMRVPSADPLRKTRYRKAITDACKKIALCPFCGAHNGQVRRRRTPLRRPRRNRRCGATQRCRRSETLLRQSHHNATPS